MKKPKDYIIFPLDLPSSKEAMSYVKKLSGKVGLFKVGLELFISSGPEIIYNIKEESGADVFLDLKLHDIPVTMQRAFVAASRHRPVFVTVHCDQGEGFLKEVAGENPGGTKILAITLLTSLNKERLIKAGVAKEFAQDLPALVIRKALMAREAGCHGIVCSGLEVEAVKKEMRGDFIAVTPGVRPAWSIVDKDDQKRIITPADAVKLGADYIVIGRPIRDARDPAEAAEKVSEEIESVL
ncbi:orotidine-5'-phosphate decarboxylase [Thermodesulfobacteriota bacterium]